MGLGVLEYRRLEHVPGTATLDELLSQGQEPQVQTSGRPLKRRNGMILVPQPSDDPRDPLNWPLWRRDLILFLLALLSVIASTLSPLLAANTLTLLLNFERNFTYIALLTGYHLLGVGCAGFIFVPSARVWGKRHLYILGTVIIIFSSIWGGASGTNYESMLAARVFQGIGLAPFEALVNASVGDLFFVHERGKRMAISNLALFGGAFFTPVLVGKMTNTIGWPWTFYLIAIFAAAMLPLLILFVPETAFWRDQRFNTDLAVTGADESSMRGINAPSAYQNNPQAGSVPSALGDANGGHYKEHFGPGGDDVERTSGSSQGPPVAGQNGEKHTAAPTTVHDQGVVEPALNRGPSIRETLPIFNGRKTGEDFWRLLLRPFPLFIQPGILVSCLIQGTLIGWTVLIGVVLAAVMLGPPLFFNEVQTGYMYTGAFVGALVGFVIAGGLSDWTAKWLTRRNHGVYEPEFRLVLVFPQLVLGCMGLYGFGITSNNTTKYGWLLPDVFFGFEVAGMVIGAVASALYLVDAHRDIAVECFTCMLVFKNIFSFGLTFSGYDWLVFHGIRPTFIIIASVQVGVCCLAVPLYVFGKINRGFWAEFDLLGRLKLK